jgi:ankyrin repeat domain-containing protein 50
MTDPLSITAGVAGLISLGVQVTESLIKFYTSYKNRDADVNRTSEKLESLLGTFQFLSSALQKRTFRPDEQDLIKNIESSVDKCDELVQELQEEFEKCEKAATNGVRGSIRTAGRRAAYPFRESTLKKLDEAIGEIRDNLSLALNVLQLRDHESTQDDLTELKSLVKAVRGIQISSTVRDWLKAPDATINHNAACAKRHSGTGIWFIKNSIFTTWLTRDNSFLWLNGFAGCGKSVLCSTAIQHTFRHKRSDPGVGIAFFYFTFNDESKQDESAMFRALLLQLSSQLSDSHTDLARLHDSYRTGIPPVIVLIVHLRHLIQKFDQVYILLDALDESPRYGQRDQVLNTIETMRKWLLPGLHLLVTSRDEPDIRESLSPVGDEEVIMKNTEINHDISNFISGQLNIDPKLRKWRAHHDRIQQVLAERAQGV